MNEPLRLVCCASGGGRTILNLLDHIEAGTLAATIECVVLSRTMLPAAERCRARGLRVHEPPSHVDIDDWVVSRIAATSPELVCLCGYLRLLPIEKWMRHRVINIHPALLPAFGGRGMHGQRVHEAVLASGNATTGCTVHFVDDEYDHGPTILQRSCEVASDDTPTTLAARVFQEECLAMPEAIQLLVEGRVRAGVGGIDIADEGSPWPDAAVRSAKSC